MGQLTDQIALHREALAGRCACITGGAGFIGGHLAEALLDAGAEVQIIDDLSTSDAEHVAHLVDRSAGRARFVYGSILDPDALSEAMDGCSLVFHLAAMASVPRSIEQPGRCFAVNTTGTLRIAEAARARGVDRWVFASSSAVYGDGRSEAIRESGVTNPRSPYAASKLAAEQIVTAWAHSYGLSGISLRYFNIFGPRQRADSAYAAVIPAFVASAQANKPMRIEGDGEQTRDFCHVDNVVCAMLLAATRPSLPDGIAVNIGCGESISINRLAETVRGLSPGKQPAPVRRAGRTGDVRHSRADITLAGEVLGYRPIVGFEQALASLINDLPAPTDGDVQHLP